MAFPGGFASGFAVALADANFHFITTLSASTPA
jgi:hypothetical protein